MRLLFLTSRLPFPPDRGDRSRVFNFLKRLSSEHEITLVSFISDEKERVYATRLSAYCSGVHVVRQTPLQSILAVTRNAWREIPFQVSYYRSRAMQRQVDELAGSTQFDAVYVHLFRMAPYMARLRDVYRIVDLTDVISQEIKQSLPFRSPLSRGLYAVEQLRIERYERRVAEACDEAWLITEHDRQVLARDCPRATLHVVPIGVDHERFFPLPTKPATKPATNPAAEPDPCAMLFVGNMGVLHNIDAVLYLVHEILPLVKVDLPEARLSIVGADPVRRITALDDNHPAVTVTGFVDDLNRVLNEASVFIAPLRFAAGLQTKVIEAMAAGKPVITTSVVNEGIRAVSGREILVADDAPSLAAQVVILCRDSVLRRQMGVAARRFATQHFRWSHVADRMRAIEGSL